MWPVVRHPAARISEIVWILTERDGGSISNGAELLATGGCSTIGLQSFDLRVGIGAEHLPASERALFCREHQAVVLHEVSIRIRHEETAIGWRVHEHAYRYDPAVGLGQRTRVVSVLATHIGPSDIVAAGLADISNRYRQPASEFPIDTNGILIGFRRACVRIDEQ